MKLIYAASALIVVAGAGIGFLTAPAPSQAGTPTAAPQPMEVHDSQPRNGGGRRSGGGGGGLPGAIAAGGGDERADCFYLRVAYNRALKGGVSQAKDARAQGVGAGCWMPDAQ